MAGAEFRPGDRVRVRDHELIASGTVDAYDGEAKKVWVRSDRTHGGVVHIRWVPEDQVEHAEPV